MLKHSEVLSKKHQVLALHLQGKTISQISTETGLRYATIWDWIKVYKQFGVQEYFLPRKRANRQKNNIDSTVLHALLVKMRTKKARAFSFPEDGWTLDTVNIVLRRELGVTYDKSHLGRILKKHHFPYRSQPSTKTAVRKAVNYMRLAPPKREDAVWHMSDIQEFVEKITGRYYSDSHLWWIMNKMGYTLTKLNEEAQNR